MSASDSTRSPQSTYFIQFGKVGPIKIGMTSFAPERRLVAIQPGCPVKLRLMAVIENPSKEESEKHLHRRFSHLRIRGEWFEPAAELMDFIAGYPEWVPISVCSQDEIQTKKWEWYEKILRVGRKRRVYLALKRKEILQVEQKQKTQEATKRIKTKTCKPGAGRHRSAKSCSKREVIPDVRSDQSSGILVIPDRHPGGRPKIAADPAGRSERIRLAALTLSCSIKVKDAANIAGVSRSTFWRWVNEFLADGEPDTDKLRALHDES